MNAKSLSLAAILLFAINRPTLLRAQATAMEGGAEAVEVIKETATVEKIDLDKRKVTLRMDDGKSKTFKVDKSVVNLDQVAVGDKVKIAYTEQVVMTVGQSKEAPAAGELSAVGLAPKGAKPGMVMVDTEAMSGKVLAVNTQKHRVTLEEPDGKKKTLKISKKATNLDQLKAGETVDITVTQALAIDVTK
jgi:Cu/Ag efflux protein CusF